MFGLAPSLMAWRQPTRAMPGAAVSPYYLEITAQALRAALYGPSTLFLSLVTRCYPSIVLRTNDPDDAVDNRQRRQSPLNGMGSRWLGLCDEVQQSPIRSAIHHIMAVVERGAMTRSDGGRQAG